MGNKKDKRTITTKKRNALVLFRFPNKSKINMIQGFAEAKPNFNKVQNAFVLRSFDSNKSYVITQANSNPDLTQLPKNKKTSTSKSSFLKYVNAIKAAIKKSEFEKVVAAKGVCISKPLYYDALSHFQQALKYKEAFVCLVFIENELCWLCATPELLLKTTANYIETFSLAGTVKEKTNFTNKEIIEQSIVTKDILEKLEKSSELKKPTVSSKIITNGNLKHLLAEIKAKKKRKVKWQKIADILHPTPATAGYPVDKALSFIAEKEKLERDFYSGYVGEVKNNNAKLFVNLRCVEITSKNLFFYGGCGITAGSDPEKEWLETEHKIDILRELIS